MIEMTVITVDSDDSNESDDRFDIDDSDVSDDHGVSDDDRDSDDDVTASSECVTRGEDREGVEAASPRPRPVRQECNLGQGLVVGVW